MAQLQIGAVIGRFQVAELHEGHKQLLDQVKSCSDRLVVMVGVSVLDGRICENPLTFSQRQSLFKNYPDAIIVPLFDEENDRTWSINLDNLLLKMFPMGNITLYGGRSSFADSYTTKSFRVETLSFSESASVQGTKARLAIKESKDPIFLQGQIYSLLQQYSKTYQTVDIAVLKDDLVLLIQRADTGKWVFPGGFVDPTDASLEDAAIRELSEELGIFGDGDVKYIASKQVDDWRYRGSRDKIMTALFLMKYSSGKKLVPNPLEVQDFKWVHVTEAEKIIANHHKVLLNELLAQITNN